MEDSVVACRWCTHSNPLHLETCEKCNRLLPASCPLGTFSASPAKSKTQKANARKRKKKDKKEENQRNKGRKNRNKNKASSATASTSNSDSNNNNVDAERSSGNATEADNMEVDQVQQPVGGEVQSMVIGDENSEEFTHVRNVLNTSGSTSPLSTSQIKDALIRHDNDVERVIDELLPLETSEESNERAITIPISAEDDIIEAAKIASFIEASVALIDSQQWVEAVVSNSDCLRLDILDEEKAASLCRRAFANYQLRYFKESLQDYESAISIGLAEEKVQLQVTRLRAILATPVEGQRVDVEEMMGTIRKVLSNADSCDIGVDLDNGEKCTLSYPSQGMYLLSTAEAELEDIDKIQDTLALATELTKPNLDSAVYDRVTKIRHSSHTLDDPITICPVGQTPDIGVDIANLKHDLSNVLKSRYLYDDASLLRIIRPLIVGIAKFDDTCTAPAQTRQKKVNFSASAELVTNHIGKTEEEELPEPIELPSVGVIALRGEITHSDGKAILSGQWAMEGVEFTKRRPCTEAFSYVNEQCSANDYSGDYVGGFKYGGTDVVDNNLTLFFVPNNGGGHNVTGSGVNAFGCFDIIGILDQDGGFDMCRTYNSYATQNTLSSAPSASADSPPTPHDDDQVTMDNLRFDTTDRRSVITEYVSDNANKERNGGGAFYKLNGGLISRLKSMDKHSESSIREIKADGVSKLSRVRDEVLLKLFPLSESETRLLVTAVDYYTTSITNAEANGLAALLFNMLCPTPFSKGGRSSAFGGTANDTATFGRCDTIAAQLTLIEVLRSQGRIQLVNSSHLMPVASENSRIDCPLTENDLEEFKKRQEPWTCPCTKQREADIITPISDVYLETQTLLGNPTVVIDGGGRSKSTELMMKGRNPNNIAVSINNLGHLQFLNRLEDVAALDDLQVINDAFVALGNAVGMSESADTIFNEFCALTTQSPPFSGQSYKSAVISFACRHVEKYGNEYIFSPKKLAVPVFYDHYARNNTQACINKFDDIDSAADIRLWHLHQLMSSRGGKKCSDDAKVAVASYYALLADELSPKQALDRMKKENEKNHSHVMRLLKFDVMTKLSALPADEVDLKKVEATAELLGMKMNDLLQNIDACRKGRSNKKVVSDSVRHLKCIEKAEKHQDVTEGQFVVSEKTTLLSRGCTHTTGITLCTACNTEFSCYDGRSFNKSILTNHASTENCKRARQLRQNNQSEGDILHLKCIEKAEKHQDVTEGQFVVSEKTTLESRTSGSTHTKGITLCTVCNTEFSCYDGSFFKKALLTNHASTKSCKRAREQD